MILYLIFLVGFCYFVSTQLKTRLEIKDRTVTLFFLLTFALYQTVLFFFLDDVSLTLKTNYQKDFQLITGPEFRSILFVVFLTFIVFFYQFVFFEKWPRGKKTILLMLVLFSSLAITKDIIFVFIVLNVFDFIKYKNVFFEKHSLFSEKTTQIDTIERSSFEKSNFHRLDPKNMIFLLKVGYDFLFLISIMTIIANEKNIIIGSWLMFFKENVFILIIISFFMRFIADNYFFSDNESIVKKHIFTLINLFTLVFVHINFLNQSTISSYNGYFLFVVLFLFILIMIKDIILVLRTSKNMLCLSCLINLMFIKQLILLLVMGVENSLQPIVVMNLFYLLIYALFVKWPTKDGPIIPIQEHSILLGPFFILSFLELFGQSLFLFSTEAILFTKKIMEFSVFLTSLLFFVGGLLSFKVASISKELFLENLKSNRIYKDKNFYYSIVLYLLFSFVVFFLNGLLFGVSFTGKDLFFVDFIFYFFIQLFLLVVVFYWVLLKKDIFETKIDSLLEWYQKIITQIDCYVRFGFLNFLIFLKYLQRFFYLFLITSSELFLGFGEIFLRLLHGLMGEKDYGIRLSFLFFLILLTGFIFLI